MKSWLKRAFAAAKPSPPPKLRQDIAETASQRLPYMSMVTVEPRRLAAAFQNADSGKLKDQSELYELIEAQDAHVFAEMAKRRRAVAGLSWDIHPPADANQADIDRCGQLRELLWGIKRFEDGLYNLTDGIGKGFAALEILWERGDLWRPTELFWVPQRRFDSNNHRLQLRKPDGSLEPLQDLGWVVHEHQALSGYLESTALFRVLAWCYAYKSFNNKDLQRFLELYGVPLRLGKYAPGTPEAERNTLLDAVRSFASDGAGIIPNTMAMEFVAVAQGKVDDFLSAIEYWERKQSLAILGGTLTSQADGKTSTNALGEVHNQVRREIMLHDVRQLEPTLNQQLLAPICLVNGWFSPDRLPRLRFNTQEVVDQEKMAKVLMLAVGLGLEVSKDWAHEMLQIPKAGEGEALQPASGFNPAALRQKFSAQKGFENLSVDDLVDETQTRMASHEEQLLVHIYKVLSQSGSFDEARAAFEELSLQQRPAGWAETLTPALAVADMVGRSGT